MMPIARPCCRYSPSRSTGSSVSTCRKNFAAAFSGARCVRPMVAFPDLPSTTETPPSGRRTRIHNGVTLQFAELFTYNCKLFTCSELSRLEAMWSGFVKEGKYADAHGLVEAYVKLICNDLAKLVEERETLALERQQRDAGLALFQQPAPPRAGI
jgi:hypothetical protein